MTKKAARGVTAEASWIVKLYDAVVEQNAQIESLRLLLVERGAFSDAAFQARVGEVRKTLAAQARAAAQQAWPEAWLALLDAHSSESQES